MDDLLEFGRVAGGEILRRPVAGEQRRGHHVDALVGALSGKDRGHQQLVRRVVSERALGVGVLVLQPLVRFPGTTPGRTWSTHEGNGSAPPVALSRIGQRILRPAVVANRIDRSAADFTPGMSRCHTSPVLSPLPHTPVLPSGIQGDPRCATPAQPQIVPPSNPTTRMPGARGGTKPQPPQRPTPAAIAPECTTDTTPGATVTPQATTIRNEYTQCLTAQPNSPRSRTPLGTAIADETPVSIVALGDSLDLLKEIPDESISLILCDPPYHSTQKNNIYGDRAFVEDDEFLSWLRQFAGHWKRILKRSGTLYVFCSSRMSSRLEVMLSEHFLPSVTSLGLSQTNRDMTDGRAR